MTTTEYRTADSATTLGDHGSAARAVGCLVGSMCGDVLAHPAHGQKAHRVCREFPRGLTEVFQFSVTGNTGRYSGTTRQMLALAHTLTTGRADAKSISDAYAAMFDHSRVYLPYERLVFTILNLNLVFISMQDAINAALAERGVDISTIDHKAYIYWFREYVDILGNLGAQSDLYGSSQFDYLGIADDSDPESTYAEYRQRLTTRTMASDPLGLQRFASLVTSNEEYVEQSVQDFAAYVAVNFETQYSGLVAARSYIRSQLQASPATLPALSWMWESAAELLRLPAAISTTPAWWFKRFFSRAVDPDTQNVGIVEELLGSRYNEVAKRLQQELQIYSYSYTSFVRSPGGCWDCGAPSRAAPFGLALPTADVHQLRCHLDEALECSHPDSAALDASVVVAAAVQWLSQADAGSVSCTPEQLLERLLEVAATSNMRGRLLLIRDNLFAMPAAADWRDVWQSREWHSILQVHQWCSQRGFTTDAHDAVAVALHCLCCNWAQPRQAVECAAHLGGWACVTASMVGAMAGALHGTEWIPTSWWDALEEGEHGRELAVALGQQLAATRLQQFPQPGSPVADCWYL